MSPQDDQDDLLGDLDLDNTQDDLEDDSPDDSDSESDEPPPQDDEPDSSDDTVDASPDEPDRRPSRADSRIRTLANEVKQKDTQLQDLNRRLDELTRSVSQPRQPQGESAEERAARRALMTVEEQIREDQREASQKHERDMRLLQFQLAESSDKSSFDALCARDKLVAKWAPKVEEELASLRAKGQTVERKLLFYYMVGKAAYESRNSPENRKQRRAAAKRVSAQTTRPSNSRSDEAPRSGQKQTSLARRLENIQI